LPIEGVIPKATPEVIRNTYYACYGHRTKYDVDGDVRVRFPVAPVLACAAPGELFVGGRRPFQVRSRDPIAGSIASVPDCTGSGITEEAPPDHVPTRRLLMTITRRRVLFASLIATPGVWSSGSSLAAEGATLKISHQFPASSNSEGDFRDLLVRKFAAEVEKRTNGKLKFAIYPGSSLMKVNAQFAALRKGALDMTLVPLPYAGGEVPELNISCIPGLVTSYEQGYAWKNAEIGRALTQFLADKGVVLVTWIWQAGGAASRGVPIVVPEDVKGLKVRGGSREMDLVIKAAGGATLSFPSNETYAAMQTGAADAVTTSSTSLLSFRLAEVSKHLTINKQGRSFWYMLEPLLMSKAIFDGLPKDQQLAIMQVGAEMEKFALEGARADDRAISQAYTKAGATVHDLPDAALKRWVALSRDTAWKDYASKNETCARLLKLADQVK
jgi:TRAP-type transport system periplasmic protein